MSQSTTTHRTRSRRGIGALLIVGVCALACALPVIGGLVAGTVVDKVLDSPAWFGLLIAVGAAITITVALRRAKHRSNGC